MKYKELNEYYGTRPQGERYRINRLFRSIKKANPTWGLDGIANVVWMQLCAAKDYDEVVEIQETFDKIREEIDGHARS